MLTRLLRKYLAPYKRDLAAVVILQAIQAFASLWLPRLNASIIDEGVSKGDTGLIWSTGAIMLAVSALQLAATICAVYYGARVAMKVGRDLRADIFHRVGTFSARELNMFGAPSLITRTTNDVQQVQTLAVMACNVLVWAPVMCIGGIVMAMREDLGLSWLLLVSISAMVGSLGSIVVRLVPRYRTVQLCIDRVNQVLREQITGIRVVRAFVRESFEASRFDRANQDLRIAGLRVGHLMAMMFPTVIFVFNASSVAVLWFGAHRVDGGDIQIGALIAFLSYLMQILMSVMFATFVSTMVPRASVCADRIGEVLETETSVVPPSAPIENVTVPPSLEFRNAEFTYPGAEAPVVKNVGFKVAPGTTTAIIGSTGSGKSTLLGLVPRLFDTTNGEVTIGDVDVKQLSPEAIAHLVGLVPQRPYLFSGTVASTLRYGDPNASDDALWEALRIAQADDFVGALPEQLNAPVAQGGTNFSGGQRQRLAIARTLISKPSIYLFDDSFSALDLGTEARLRTALAPYVTNAAVVVVGQRISSILHANQIVVLDDGAIVGIGTHQHLLATNPTYREIVESQITADDAA